MARAVVAREVRVAPGIWKTHYGWRVYVRRVDEQTGRTKLAPARFPPETTIEELEHFRDTAKLETKRVKIAHRKLTGPRPRAVPARQVFPADADAYLQLKTVRAMVAYKDRVREIELWKKVFRKKPRRSITTRDVDQQLQALADEGYAGSSVNKFRAALMSVWTQLDGRGAANPVKNAKVFPEAEEIPRGQDTALIRAIIDTIPIYKPRKKGAPKVYNLSRVCLELMLATGFAPAHIARLEPTSFSLADRWYVLPRRKKGKVVRRPAPMVRIRMTAAAARAFKALVAAAGAPLAAGTWEGVDRKDLSHTWQRACRRYERQRREDEAGFSLPRIRLYDIRHSFATALLEETENVGTVATFIGTTPRTARRYSIGAVPIIVEKAAAAMERRARRRRAGNKKVR